MLEDKYRKVVNNYLVNGGNKRKACLDAGYSKNSVNDVFSRKDVQEEIQRRFKESERKTDMDREWLLEKLKTIIEAEPGELLEVDQRGRPSLNFNKLSPSLRSAISKVSVTQTKGGGKYKQTKTHVNIDTPDRIAAIKEAAQLLGLREQHVKINLEDDLIERISQARNWDDEEEDVKDGTDG